MRPTRRPANERHMPSFRRALILLALVIGAPGLAGAEDLNRSALEQLFGEPVTTSATGKPQRVSDVPVAMDIITAEQIRRSGAHDIPGVLARYTTLDVQRYGPDDYSVGVRGYAVPNTPRLLVLVDGRQVYFDDYGRTVWSAIPVQLIEIRQIEVVRGPNTALFGFNAAAGVINIVTFSPSYDRVNSVIARGGTGGYGELSAAATAPLPGSGGVRVSAGMRRQDPFSRGYSATELAEGVRAPAAEEQAATTAEFGLGSSVRVGLDANYAAINGDHLNNWFITHESEQVWSLRGRVSADTAYGVLDASLTYTGMDERLGGTPTWRQGTTTLELSDTVKLGSAHTVRPFVQFRTEGLQESADLMLRTPMPVSGMSVNVGYDIASAGVMWNWAITDSLEWTGALRGDQLWLRGKGYDAPGQPFSDSDYNRRAFGTLAYNAALVWKPTALDTVRVSAARGIQSPSLAELGARFSQLFGSPYAPVTVVDDYEVGYRRRLQALSTDIDITGFTQANRSFSSSLYGYPNLFPPAVAAPTTVPASLGTSHDSGVEVSVTTHLSPAFEVGVKYRGVFIGSGLEPVMIDYQRASPRHIATAHVGWTRGKWEADLFVRYASSMSGFRAQAGIPMPVSVKDYVTTYGRIGYRVTPRLTAALEAEDMLQAHQVQNIGTVTERRFYLSLRADF
jgi:outer membrane receptor for ferrienterochelin and colicins